MTSKTHNDVGDITFVEAVNAGGEAVVSADGLSFAADTGSTGGNSLQTTVPIKGSPDAAIYQSQVRSESGFVYSTPVDDGVYVVELHFAELGVPSAGGFSVQIENEPVLKDLNVATAAGGANVAYVHQVAVPVSDGSLTLSVSPGSSAAMLSGYSVWRADDQDAALAAVAPDWTADGAVAGVFGTGLGIDGIGELPEEHAHSDLIEIGSAAHTPPKNFIAAVNAGGDTYVMPDGTVFVGDNIGVGQILRTDAPIANTANDALYQTQLWDPSGFVYSLPVEGGAYTIALEFAAIGPNEAGGTFDVVIEGETVIDDLDVVAEAGGPNTAYTAEVDVEVEDGSLTISATPETGVPAISGFTVWNTGRTLSALDDGNGAATDGGNGTAQDGVQLAALGGGGGSSVTTAFVSPPTPFVSTPVSNVPIVNIPSGGNSGGNGGGDGGQTTITPTGPRVDIPLVPEIDAFSGLTAIALVGAMLALLIERRRRLG